MGSEMCIRDRSEMCLLCIGCGAESGTNNAFEPLHTAMYEYYRVGETCSVLEVYNIEGGKHALCSSLHKIEDGNMRCVKFTASCFEVTEIQDGR